MSMGAWALTLFGNLIGSAVVADLLGKEQTARVLGGATAITGGYLGSYTGVLLASTAVPVWARSRLFLGPIFVSTATATGAAAVRLALDGLDPQHPTRKALGQIQATAMVAELVLSQVNERRLGKHAAHGPKFTLAKWLVRGGLALQAARRHSRIPSLVYLAAGLLFRYAWVEVGPVSARDDRAVAEMARSTHTPV
jgi:formate-dependent nitrite reductase membrane component NrfD